MDPCTDSAAQRLIILLIYGVLPLFSFVMAGTYLWRGDSTPGWSFAFVGVFGIVMFCVFYRRYRKLRQ